VDRHRQQRRLKVNRWRHATVAMHVKIYTHFLIMYTVHCNARWKWKKW